MEVTALLCVALGGLSALTLKHGHSSLSDTSSPPSTPPSAILVNLFNFLLLCSSHHLTQSQHNPHSVCPSREHSSHLHRCSSRVPRWCPQTTALCHLWRRGPNAWSCTVPSTAPAEACRTPTGRLLWSGCMERTV